MREMDSEAFGRRVKDRRLELGLSQTELGEASGYSQQNIVTIEAGRQKRPQRSASDLATALRTSREWLLWEEGPKECGTQYLSSRKLVEKYETLPIEVKAAISELIENSGKRRRGKRRST